MKLLIVSGFIISCFINIQGFDSDWWKHSIVYELFMPSFKDGNGDGIGDFAGITSKLDHFVDLGIDTIWFTPFLKSPKKDWGYDTQNYTETDPVYGTLNDFDNMIQQMKKKGLKLIMDLVINHCSSTHEWFQKSIDKIKPYDEYFIWMDPKGYDSAGNPIPPNNWKCVFGGGIWEWNNKRNQFYLHQFSATQPDLNLRNSHVKESINKIIKFWLDRGVSGFRLDAASHFFEDSLLRNEPPRDSQFKFDDPKLEWQDLDHVYTLNLWEVCEYIHDIRTFLDEYNKQHGGYERILIPEVVLATLNMTMAYYGTDNYKVTHYPFNFLLVEGEFLNAKTIASKIQRWMRNIPKGKTANWMNESHDVPRLSSKYSKEHANIIMMIIMMLPGISGIYYGQEIGMSGGSIRRDQVKDSIGAGGQDTYLPRDFERQPMQWDDTMNAGFTSNSKAWLPVNSDYWKVNVEIQKAQPNSYYYSFKNLSNLRKTDVFKYGDFQPQLVSEWVYAFSRKLTNNLGYYVVLVNLGREYEIINLYDHFEDIPSVLYVKAGTVNSGFLEGHEIKISSEFPELFILKPFSGVVLSTVKHDAE